MSDLMIRNSSYDETERVAAAMVKSGYFTDTREVAQAIVKILAGREMGFGAFASMTGVYIIQGRPSIGANLMASAVKRSGRYDYRVLEMTDTACEIEYFQGGKSIGKSRFTIEDARKAQTKNLDKFPRNMLFARAMSNGVRWFVPDVFDGAAVYTPEELGATVNEAGDVIDIEVPKPAPVTPEPAARSPMNNLANEIVKTMTGEELAPRSATWPKATIDAVVSKYKLTSGKHAENLLKLTGMPFTSTVDDLVEWIDEYRAFKNQAGPDGKPLYTTEQAAELVAEAREMKAEIAANGE